MRWRLVALVVTLLAVCTGAPADQNDPRLASLFEALRASPGPQAARTIESRIWQIWLESGDEDVDRLMGRGMEAMSQGHLEVAVEIFGRIVTRLPGFAEGWNKRATAYYLLDEHAASVEDIRRTLALEPRHFGAISGMGLIFLETGDPHGALRAFEQVIEVHPHAPGARQRIESLRSRLEMRSL